MADIEIIRGQDNGNPPDTLRQAYPKINRNFGNVNNQLVGHINSNIAHSSEHIKYAGDVAGAENVKEAVDNLKTTIDQAIVNGDSGPEAAAARFDSITDETYATLKDRLDNSSLQILQQDQEDFVSSISNQMFIKGMYLTCNAKNTCNFSIGYELPDNKGLMYYTAPQQNDNYSILQGGRVGDLSSVYMTFAYQKYTSKSGTFNETFAPNCFTTTVGDSMTVTFTGAEEIAFNHFKDNRGGRWKFTLQNVVISPVYISCYASVAQSTFVPLFSGLDPAVTYTIVGEFLGDDPDHVPSGGAGTSRGWYCISTDSNTANFDTFFLRKKSKSITNYIEPLRSGSNKEYAFSLRRKGESYPYQFFPLHSGIVTTVKEREYEIYIDGVLYNSKINNAETINNINKVEIIQYIYCKLPDDVKNLGYLTSKHTFTKDGVVTINCSFKALENIEINAGYVNMVPVLSQFCKKLNTSLMTSYPTIKTAGYTDMSNEKDKVYSYIWGNGDREDIVVACTSVSPMSSLRKGKSGRRTPLTWIEHRDAVMQKLYPQVFQNSEMKQNEVFTFGARYILGITPNLSRLYFM